MEGVYVVSNPKLAEVYLRDVRKEATNKHSTNSEKTHQMTLLQRWKNTSLPNKLMVETGALVAIGTLFYASAAAFQAWLMKRSADDAAKQNELLLVEANRIARSMEATLAQSKAALETRR